VTLAQEPQKPQPASRARGAGRCVGGVATAILSLALTFLGLLAVTFVIGRVIPVDPALAMVGDQASQETYLAAREALGLDEPMLQQFVIYVRSVLAGDLGVSLTSGRPVGEDLARVFPATIELATSATLIGVCLGIPLGMVGAAFQDRPVDHLVRTVALFGYSTPVFWLALMVLVVFYGQLGWAPGTGRQSVFYDGIVETRTGLLLVDAALAREWAILRDALAHLAMPAMVIGFASTGYVTRMTRSLLITELSKEYVLAARIKGVGRAGIVWQHAMPNIAVPLVTVVLLTYATNLEGAIVTEIVFSWPGIGSYVTNALFAADMPAVLGGTIVVGIVFVLLNQTADLLYRLLDPRTTR